MEEKKAFGRNNSLWPFFGFGNFFSFLLRRKNNQHVFPVGSNAGFTLIELLLVILILGIISVLFFMFLDPLGQLAKARDAQRKNDLAQLQRVLETYYNDNKKYPASSTDPAYRIVRLDGSTADWGEQWIPYMNVLPKDPTSSRNYVYFSPEGGQSYYIYVSLERTHDPQACQTLIDGECQSIRATGITANSCGPSSSPQPCNYGVSSPNVSP